MRWILWGGLLANVLLLAYFNLPPRTQVELHVVQAPLHPEKIRLPNAAEIDALPPRVTAQAVAADACYEWGTFASTRLASARQALSALGQDAEIRPHTAAEAARYWVYIPGFRNPQAAQARLDALRALGVDEMYVVQDPQLRSVISLGVFKDEQLATRLLDDLRGKGVTSAVKGIRNREDGRASLYLRNVSPALAAQIETLRPEYPGSELKQVFCQ